MTEQEALDTAAIAADGVHYNGVRRHQRGKPALREFIRAHAASLQRIAELEAKLSSLTPSEEDRKLARSMLASWDISNPGTARLLRKYVLQEQPVDPVAELAREAFARLPSTWTADDLAAQLRAVSKEHGFAIVKEGV